MDSSMYPPGTHDSDFDDDPNGRDVSYHEPKQDKPIEVEHAPDCTCGECVLPF